MRLTGMRVNAQYRPESYGGYQPLGLVTARRNYQKLSSSPKLYRSTCDSLRVFAPNFPSN